MEEVTPSPYKRKRKIKPTIKQIKTLQNINQGMSVRKAMIEAGYAVKQANKSTRFFRAKGAQAAIESMKGFLENVGLSNVKMATKIAEFVDAQKIDHSHTEPDRVVPDYKTQIEGVRLWNEVLDRSMNPKARVKKEMTITEFIED